MRGIVLVTVAEGSAAADAVLNCPDLTWTVFTRTGFMGSDAPGIVEIGIAASTPLFSTPGSFLRDGNGAGIAAVAAAITDGLTITGAAGVALEAHGIFIIPRWSGDFEAVVVNDAGPS